ncbi:MAG: glycoside hydrolase family 55 protein [Bacteroidales bacterium]|nr:glycoside hydrolase family 55 protein [Bacteroidales bacterium]
MQKTSIILSLLLMSNVILAQVIPDSVRVNWQNAGYDGTMPNPSTILNVMDFGATGNGQQDDWDAVISAIDSLQGNPGVVYFPEGTFLLQSPLNLPSNVILRGTGADSTAIYFDLNQQPQNCIVISGQAGGSFVPVTGGLEKGSSSLTLDNASGFSTGDYAELRQENGDWDSDPAPWAEKVVGQMVKITGINGQTITIDQPLRIDYEPELNPEIRKIEPARNIGIECMKIHRADSVPAGAGDNITMNMAVNCWVIGVESYKSVSSHIGVVTSKNIELSGNYIHHAFTYDGSGKRGYGITLNNHSSDCLIENNILRHLRHAMMVKTGANGNVFAYNYSIEPHRPEFPSDAGGDISLHGHYAFANLFEGNIVQNIIIDHYWGPSGPYNTFFRNRAELYGIIFTSSETETDHQNLVGNEVTNTQWFHGLYNLSGEGHFEYGNNVKGTIIPSGTDDLTDTTYFYEQQPEFWTVTDNWPTIGIPNELDSGTIPAESRYLQGSPLTLCRDLSFASQSIQLNSGYQFVSTYRIPVNPDMMELLATQMENGSLEFVRNTDGDMLHKIGPDWVNGIGDWSAVEGYLFKMNNGDELIIQGEQINPQTPIQLEAGYQFVSYLPDTPLNAITAFDNILNNGLEFVRNTEGDMLRKIGPNWVNGIGELEPAEGYLIKMNNAAELIYSME